MRRTFFLLHCSICKLHTEGLFWVVNSLIDHQKAELSISYCEENAVYFVVETAYIQMKMPMFVVRENCL